jgi:hypothetical protein
MIMNSHGLKEGLRHLLDEAFTRGVKSTGLPTYGKAFADERKRAVERMLSEIFEGD